MNTHRIEIATRNEKRFLAVRRYRAECRTCEFRGEWRRNREDAAEDGYAHQAWIQGDEAA